MGDKPTPEDMMKILNRYEGAVNAVEVDGDEGALAELEEARTALLELLKKAI